MNDNHHDPKKNSDEELKKLIDELKRRNYKNSVFTSFGFMLHRDYVVHLLLSLGINIIIMATVMGISIGIGEPLVATNSIMGFLLAATLLTLLENMVKILLYRYAFRAILYSLGILSLAITMLIFYVINLIMQEGFYFESFIYLLIFTVGFTFFRLVLSTYVRRWMYIKNKRFNRR